MIVNRKNEKGEEGWRIPGFDGLRLVQYGQKIISALCNDTNSSTHVTKQRFLRRIDQEEENPIPAILEFLFDPGFHLNPSPKQTILYSQNGKEMNNDTDLNLHVAKPIFSRYID